MASIQSSVANHANFIWQIADLLRGDYKQSDYGKVILPFTVLRRLDSVLSDTKEKVLSQYEKTKGTKMDDPDVLLNKIDVFKFHNHSKYDFQKLSSDLLHQNLKGIGNITQSRVL